MVVHLNIHLALERLRLEAERDGSEAPKVVSDLRGSDTSLSLSVR